MMPATETRNDPPFRIFAAVTAIISVPLALSNLLTMLLATNLNISAISDPVLLLRTGASGAAYWRWSMMLDLFGYYLMIIPIVIYLRYRLRPRSPNWVDLSALCLVSYSLIGAAGAAILATSAPPLIRAYEFAGPVQRVILETASATIADSVYRGLWNLLEEWLAGVGWILLGAALHGRHRRLGIVTIALGVACLVDSLGSMLELDMVALAGLVVYLLLAPIWAGWVGVSLVSGALLPEE